MTTEKEIQIAGTILKTGIVNSVYHSCELLLDKNGSVYPVYSSGGEYKYVGVDDTKGMFAYIRDNGDSYVKPFNISSCKNTYEASCPLKVVFFSDYENRNHNDIITKISEFTFMERVSLNKISTDKFKLSREESDIFRERFDAGTFYVSFDIIVKIILLPNTCDIDLCKSYINPICK